MDIARIDEIIAQDDELAVIPIYQKNGDPYLASDDKTPCTISVYGPESKAAKKAKRVEWRKLSKRAGQTVEVEEYDASRLEKAAALVADWSGWESNGQPAECTPQNVKALLAAEHILAQVEAGIARHAAFLGR
jgi:hypothetical protein